jgi:hypothetical protein
MLHKCIGAAAVQQMCDTVVKHIILPDYMCPGLNHKVMVPASRMRAERSGSVSAMHVYVKHTLTVNPYSVMSLCRMNCPTGDEMKREYDNS